MLKRKVTVTGRPKEIKGGGKQMMLYLDNTRTEDFRKLCAETGITLSEGIRQLMEQELEKNEVGETNPTNIQYGIHANNNSVNLTLDKFMRVDDARNIVSKIAEQDLPKAHNNTRLIIQQIQFRQEGKITLC